MSEENAVMDAPSQAHETSGLPSPGDIFEQAKAGMTAIQAVDPNATPPQEEPAKAKPTPKKDAKDAPKSDIPDEILYGKKAPEADKPEATKEATDDPDDAFSQDLPASSSEKAKANWKIAREQNKSLRLELQQTKSELEQIRKAPVKPDANVEAERKAWLKEREDLVARVERADIRQSPRFQRLEAKEKSILEDAALNLKGLDGVSADIVELAAHAKGASRRKILEEAGLDGGTLGLIAPYIARLDEIAHEKGEIEGSAKEILAQETARQKAEAAERKAKIEAEEAAVFERVGKEAQQQFAPLQKVKGEQYEDWNTGVEERLARAKEFYSGNMSLEDVARIAYAGVSYEAAEKMNTYLREQLTAAKDQITKLTAGQPNIGTLRNGENGSVANDATMSDEQRRTIEFNRGMAEHGAR
jgi:hypothetical protein